MVLYGVRLSLPLHALDYVSRLVAAKLAFLVQSQNSTRVEKNIVILEDSMNQTKTITLCDGFEVTFGRRLWDEACNSTLEHMEAMAAIAESDKPEAVKQLEALKLDLAFREKPLKLYVKDWPQVKPRLSQAGFSQLERELMDFSKAELVQGN